MYETWSDYHSVQTILIFKKDYLFSIMPGSGGGDGLERKQYPYSKEQSTFIIFQFRKCQSNFS